MKLRVARHTKNLDQMIKFYRDLLGMKILGSFENHENYSGVFLGFLNENWHLEFTVSDEKPVHKPDEDDLLVFYMDSRDEFENMLEKFVSAGIKQVKPKNPYWGKSSATFTDPDGYRIVLTLPLQKS